MKELGNLVSPLFLSSLNILHECQSRMGALGYDRIGASGQACYKMALGHSSTVAIGTGRWSTPKNDNRCDTPD